MDSPDDSVQDGHGFVTAKPADSAGWKVIRLAWRQKVAAYWAISWPAWLGAMTVLTFGGNLYADDKLQEAIPAIAIAMQVTFFAIQALLTGRLVRKNYRTFRVDAVHASGIRSRNLSVLDALRVWTWIIRPEVVFQAALAVVVFFWGDQIPESTKRLLTSNDLLRFLVFGPIGVGWATKATYPGFRLEPHGMRYI